MRGSPGNEGYAAHDGETTNNEGKHWDEKIGHKRDPAPPGAPLTPVGRGEQDWGPIHLSEHGMNDTLNADNAIRQLQKQHAKPFFLAFGTFNPHMPWYVPKKYFDMFPLGRGHALPADVPSARRDACRRRQRTLCLIARHLPDAGGTVRPATSGLPRRSLAPPLLRNPHADWESTAFTGLTSKVGPWSPYISLRNEAGHYIRYGNDQEEFYDTTKDPREWTNEIGNPDYEPIISKMRRNRPQYRYPEERTAGAGNRAENAGLVLQ